MKKIIKEFWILTILLSVALSSYAYDFEVDGIYYSKNSDGKTVYVTYGITYYNSYSGSVVIPSTVTYSGTTYSVTEIGDGAFRECSGLTSVTIPNSVTSIGGHAFYNCSKLTSVTIPNSVTSIGEWAFAYCSGLTSVTIPNSVTSIGYEAFKNCRGLTKVEISDIAAWCKISFGNYNANPFYYAHHLYQNGKEVTNLVIPNSVTSIGSYAFYNCSGLTSVTIPNSVTSIGNSAFYGCSGLTSVTIGNSVTSIGGSAFDGTAWFNNQPDGLVYAGKVVYKYKGTMPDNTSITIKNGTLGIAEYAFSGCSGLTSVTIPNSVTSIGDRAFQNCSGLTSVTIPNSVTSIREYAFSYCSGLTSVTIPNSVTSIGESTFSGCSGLTSVTIPNSVTSIGDYAFEDCSSLKAVVFGSGLKKIGSNAFYNCSLAKTFWLPNTPPSGTSNVKSSVYYVANDQYSFSNQIKYQFLSSMFAVDGTIYVPVSPSERTCDVINCTYSPDDKAIVIKNKVINKGVELSVLKINPYSHIGNPFIENLSISYNGPIGHHAFQNCDALKSATVENCGSIGDYAFQNCDALKSSTVENCGSIGDYAFQNCDVLESATVDNCGSVGDSAFQNCDALKLATIKNCGPIGDSAFENCDALKSATVEKCGSIGDYAFQNCDALESAIVENNGLIGNSAFSGCTSLKTVTLGSSVTGIGDMAFYNCSSLDKIIVPDAVKTVGTSAFAGCVALENASIGKGVLSLPQSVFSRCTSLSSLTIPNNVKSIGNYAFSGCTSLSDITIEDGEKKDSTSQQTPVWFADWTSTNHNSSSTSYQEYSFEVRGGNFLSFDYSVSSESGYDHLIIKLNETQIVKESGNKSGSYNKEFTEAGTYTLYLSYTKDSSTSSGSDQASVTNICVSNGVPFSSLSLGSNGSSPLFNDCPLDEVYIGRKLSYTTNSSAGYSPFYRNTSLRRVRITDAETQIYDNEFYGCSNLQALTIGNGVTTIGKWAFSGCSAMKDFSVGSKVESIGQEAFSDCTGLTSFYSYSIVPPTCGNQALDDINKWECSLYVPDDCISAYQAADQWKEFFFIYGGEEEMSIEDKSAPNIVSGVLRCDGVFTDVYTLFGVKVYSGNGEVKLEGGVYIVVANGHATKVMVK